MERNIAHPLQSSSAPAENAGVEREFLRDLGLRLQDAKKAEQYEKERHKAAMNEIADRIAKISSGIDLVRDLYPGVSVELPAAEPVDTGDKQTVVAAPVAVAVRGGRFYGGMDPEEVNRLEFPRGALRIEFLKVLKEENTFMSGDEMANALRTRYPEKVFSNKRVTDALKDGRLSKVIIGQRGYRGKFAVYLNGLLDFYSDPENGILRPEYAEKLSAKLTELGLSEKPEIEEEKRGTLTPPLPDITDEDIATAQQLLKTPKSLLKLF